MTQLDFGRELVQRKPGSEKQQHHVPKWLRQGLGRLVELIMNALELVFAPIQRVVGVEHMGYFFVLPNLLVFGIFVLFPMLLNFYYAFTGGTNIFPQDRIFVGTENFEVLLRCDNYTQPNTCQEDIFWRSIYNTFFFVTFQVSSMVFISLVTALALNRNIKGRGFFRSIFFYPVLLSPIVVGLIWRWILARNGILNAALVSFGIDEIVFLSEANWARFWVVFVSVWAQMGFYTLILLAGLQSIPYNLYEAGQIDGANKWQSFWHITMPLLMPTMFVVLVLALIRAVQVFDQVFVLTGGGPGTATRYMVQYIYETAFAGSSSIFGLAAAASVMLGGALFILTMIQLYLGRRSESA
jgi:alpha-1,4-digalacturonate transport system permease protein